MRSLLTNRFEVSRILQQTADKITFVGKDFVNRESDVVVKIFRKGTFSSDREGLAKFFSWHRGVQHPHLAKVLDAGLTENRDLFCVREYLEELKLDSQGEEVWIRQLISAIALLHLGHQVHAAITSQNILASNGVIKLADPQIPQIKAPPTDPRTIPFIAPEILTGSNPSAASDMYSLGAVLYRALSGTHPFDDFDLENLRSKYIWASCKPLNSICHTSDSISSLVASLLDKDRAVRPTVEVVKGFFSADVPATTGPFVGRGDDLQKVQAYLMKPSPSLKVVLIEGEPGIGKTRLISELEGIAKLNGQDFVVGTCHRNGAVPYKPFLQALEYLLRQRARTKSDLKHQLGNFSATLTPYFGFEADAKDLADSPQHVVSDLVGLLRLLAEARPVTLVIEDIDLADESSWYVLEQLHLRAAELPLNLILTRRTQAEPTQAIDSFAKALTENSLVCRLKSLEHAVARTLSSYLALPNKEDEICKISAGNALLLEEHASQGLHSARLSPRLEQTLLRTLDSLSKSSIDLLQALTIFNTAVSRHMLRIVSRFSESEFESTARDLTLVGLITMNGDQISLKTNSLKDHFYSRTPVAVRIHLHRRAYELLNRVVDEQSLAHHAFHGQLYDEAAPLCISVATRLCAAGQFPAAIPFYKWAMLCLRRRGRQLSPQAKSDLALCYARTGKPRLAKKIYRNLLISVGTSQDRAFVASIYYRLADPLLKKTSPHLIRMCRRAIDESPAGSPQLSRYYALLAQLLLRAGELRNAEKALISAEEEANEHVDDPSVMFFKSAKAFVLLQTGKFQEALSAGEAVRTDNTSLSPRVLHNVALCWEHLGKLRRACQVQFQAKNEADAIEDHPIRVVSFINLGAFETKLGEFQSAIRHFAEGSHLIAELHKLDKRFNFHRFWMWHLDFARLQIALGQYQQARENLKLVPTKQIREMEDAQFTFTQCELHIQYSDFSVASGLLKSLARAEVSQSEYLQVERMLLQSEFDDVDLETRLTALLEAHLISVKLGTLYQRCRLANRLSALLLACGRNTEARERAREASVLARRYGYKVLGAKALLFSALSTEEESDKETGLLKAFHTGSEMGLRELTAEAAFHIAALYYTKEQLVMAEEYLAKSVSITKELAEGVPLRSRAAYLSHGWRANANALVETFKKRRQHAALSSYSLSIAGRKDQPYFQSVYRFTLASGRATTREDFISVLLQTMESTRRSIILATQEDKKTAYYPAAIKVSDELSSRIQMLRSKAGRNVYFGNPGKIDPRAPLAWIPLHGRSIQGGIYIGYRQGESALSEEEMEFLTIIGTVANAMLAQFDNRPEHSQKHLTQLHGMVGASKAIREVYAQVEIAAGNAATVLIEGESGTGKELVARAIHQAGPRAKEAFIAVDCGALPESLIEAELFGAKKGSYTGAAADRPGLFEAAHRGTIFLDEISNTTPALQAKLLRVIQQREVRRLGETKDRPIDVRLIVASNANLETLAEEARFRKDLLYRLKVLHIKVPPLRTRSDDIPMLAHSFLEKLNAANNTKKYFGAGVITRLSTHQFPGNVRELQNAVERAFFSARGMMISDVLVEGQREAGASQDEIQTWFKDLSEGRKDFWAAVHNRYKRRDISREKVLALVDFGLRSTHGNYKMIASAFRLKEKDYRRFMDFLRRNDCLLDFRPYRKSQEAL